MKSIRFTSKALFVALLSTGLFAPMVKAEGTVATETFTNSIEQVPVNTQDPVQPGFFTKACDFAKDNVKAAGIGAAVGTAAVIVAPTVTKAAKKAVNFVKKASWKKRLAIATGAAAATAATVGGLWYANYLPTFETVKSIPSVVYNFVCDNPIQTAVGTGAAAVAAAVTSGAKKGVAFIKAKRAANCPTCKRQPRKTPTPATQAAPAGTEVFSTEEAKAIYPTMTAGSDRDMGYVVNGEFVNTGNQVTIVAQKPMTVIARATMSSDALCQMDVKKGQAFYTSYRPVFAHYLAQQ